MSEQKNNYGEIKTFKFGQLIPHDNEYAEGAVSDFELKPLKDAAAFKNNLNAEVIRSNRNEEAKTTFSIDPIVREHRGLLAQEDADYEQKVADEVERRLQILSKDAFQEGFETGQKEGADKAYQEGIVGHKEKIAQFASVIDELASQRKDILESSEAESYKLIKNLTKWIVLKEVGDKDYILRLLEKLILEMNTKMNLLIRVDSNSFQYMPEVISEVEKKIGNLTNVRVEIGAELENKGIILESENGIIDGSMKAQLASIDKIFDSVAKGDFNE